jgi:hypothetical protein
MSNRGSLQRKCVKGHPKAAGRCSGRCIRYYPRLELPRGPDGTEIRFEDRRVHSLRGVPGKWHLFAAFA